MNLKKPSLNLTNCIFDRNKKMTDRLLGNYDQILESEKNARIKQIFDKMQRLSKDATDKPENMKENIFNEICKLTALENDLHAKYPDLPPENGPIFVNELECTCHGCPTSWIGKSNEGEVHIRYRGGHLSIFINDNEYFTKQLDFGENESIEVYQERYGNYAQIMFDSHQNLVKFNGGYFSYDGFLSEDELKEATKGWLVIL